ncbi:terminase gpA endonuclease subunit [Aureliella helgolandensis]|uniref:Phage terminase large subunit (GpA) n=1 Tax=Aureliella helgolandensis TaxID=2527968 RepID=A0A518G4B9_9BACT|nr:terminase gpA endonuclease subunit [Aureliella helgolandensis]QDV23444.1 Phage terminase large subunit (GpA) [Aureliella helgolandensis]
MAKKTTKPAPAKRTPPRAAAKRSPGKTAPKVAPAKKAKPKPVAKAKSAAKSNPSKPPAVKPGKPVTIAKPASPDKLSPKAKEKAAYTKHRERAAARARFQSSGQREIGPLPPVADPQRRHDCGEDLQLALETYFPDVFALGWSSQHVEVIDALNQVLRFGGLYALGMPRGSGKTSLCIHCGVLAMLYGWRSYLVLLGAAAEAAYEMMDIVKVQLETNPLLLADFPEICHPIWQLEGIPQRGKGQMVGGEPTLISWSGRKKIVLPTVTHKDGRVTGGTVLQAVGLLGRIRGMLHQRSDGKSLRPDAFLGDDLQTDQSAKKVAQVERRETLLNGAVMGLAGPGKRIAGLSTVTIVQKGDLADRLLDRTLNPHWQGRTFSLVERWPTNTAKWEEYAELREVDLRAGQTLLPRATKLYRDHRKIMDIGAVVPWAQRRLDHELSALQSAQNLRLANPTTFEAEYQNNPQVSNTAIGQVAFPSSDDIVQRANGYARGDIPTGANHIFTAIDVQQDVLYWLQLALADDFTGWIIDYGTYPEQPLGAYWTLGQLQISLRQKTNIPDIQGAWFAGINNLMRDLYARSYVRDDGAEMSIDHTIIDANYGDSKKSVYNVCRQNPNRPIPFHGKGITAKQTPLDMRKKKQGERVGEEWFIPSTKGTKAPRHVISDTNILKTMIARRFLIPQGAGGDWTLFQASVAAHRMFADQASAEYPIETEGRGRKLLEWMLLPGRDNHWGDCLVMAGTLGLMAGCMPNKERYSKSPAAKRTKKSLQQLRAEAQAKRAA